MLHVEPSEPPLSRLSSTSGGVRRVDPPWLRGAPRMFHVEHCRDCCLRGLCPEPWRMFHVEQFSAHRGGDVPRGTLHAVLKPLE